MTAILMKFRINNSKEEGDKFMICPKCKNEYKGEFCPNCDAPKKKRFIIIRWCISIFLLTGVMVYISSPITAIGLLISSLIICPPISKKLDVKVKPRLQIIIAVVLFSFSMIIAPDNIDSPNESATSTTVATAQTANDTTTEALAEVATEALAEVATKAPAEVTTEAATESTIEEKEKIDPAIKKAAKKADAELWAIALNIDINKGLLVEGINLAANGEGTLLELYDLTKQIDDNFFNYFRQSNDIDNDSIDKYRDAVQYYIANCQSITENVMKYIDKGEMKYLSKAKSSMEDSSSYTMQVVSERMQYLANNGFTDKEISKLLESKE